MKQIHRITCPARSWPPRATRGELPVPRPALLELLGNARGPVVHQLAIDQTTRTEPSSEGRRHPLHNFSFTLYAYTTITARLLRCRGQRKCYSIPAHFRTLCAENYNRTYTYLDAIRIINQLMIWLNTLNSWKKTCITLLTRWKGKWLTGYFDFCQWFTFFSPLFFFIAQKCNFQSNHF